MCVKVEVAVLGSPSLTLSPYGLCGRKATLNLNYTPGVRAQELCESRGADLGPDSTYGLCGRKATRNRTIPGCALDGVHPGPAHRARP